MDVKSIFASKTIWGAVIMIAPTILGLLGLSSADASDAASKTAAFATEAATYVGFVLAIWGRLTASKKLSLTGK